MKRSVLGFALGLVFSMNTAWAAKVGSPAPDFTGTSTKGEKISLSNYKGKYVVLEWHNKDCPYVRAHYDSGSMQKLQKEWMDKGVVWLVVNSSAKGKQGAVDAQVAEEQMKKDGSSPTAYILDSDGSIGKLYGAQTTPHMYVIDPNGTLIYNGAIDDKVTTDKDEVLKSNNYVAAALTEAMAGKPVSKPTSRPYGCTVKY